MQEILQIPFRMNELNESICSIKWLKWVLAGGKCSTKLSWKNKETIDPVPLSETHLSY